MRGTFLRSGMVCALALAFTLAAIAQETAKHPITFDDMIKMYRVAEPHISPDGKWVVYIIATPDMDANRNAGNIWMVSTAGGAPQQPQFSARRRRPDRPLHRSRDAIIHSLLAFWA